MADTDLLIALRASNEKLQSDLNRANRRIDRFSSRASSGLGNFAASVGPMIAGAFAVDQILSFGRAVVDTVAEFQRYEAVLTTALGTNSAAQSAMEDIVAFASQTPFAVAELTDAFVKLTNQGFTPSVDQMRQMGDVAASTGKSFDQLAEAIIDAQTGEFERLKEFGIRAKKEGDKVTFTFKGQETQVNFTDEAIRNYVVGLGDAAGVSGSMAAISETVGGKISNLGDNFTQLKLTIGNQSSGLIASGLDFINTVLKGFQIEAASTTTVLQRLARIGLAGLTLGISEIVRIFKQGDDALDKQNEKLARQEGTMRFYNQSIEIFAKKIKEANGEAEKSAIWDELRQKISLLIPNVKQGDRVFEDMKKKIIDLNTEVAGPTGLDKGLTSANKALEKLNQSTREAVQLGQQGISFFTLPTVSMDDFNTKIVSDIQIVKDAFAELGDIPAEAAPEFEASVATFSETAQAAQGALTGALSGFAQAVGDGSLFENPIGTILNIMGQGLQSIGGALVSYGILMSGVFQALSNPATAPLAIGIGLAAIAAGAALSALASRQSAQMSGALGGPGGTGSGSFEGSATGQALTINLDARASGNDLEFVVRNQERLDGRLRG